MMDKGMDKADAEFSVKEFSVKASCRRTRRRTKGSPNTSSHIRTVARWFDYIVRGVVGGAVRSPLGITRWSRRRR